MRGLGRFLAWLTLAVALASPAAAQRIIGKPPGLYRLGAPAGGGATLPYTPVILLGNCDSQGFGTTETGGQTTMIAAYTAPAGWAKVLNASGAWVDYVPGTMTGVNGGSNTGNVGSEVALLNGWYVAYPNDPPRLIKDCVSGSTQALGAALGTFTGRSDSGNIMVVESGTAPSNGNVLTGTTVPAGTWMPFAQTPPNYYLMTIGQGSSYTGGAWASQTVTRYNGYASWDPVNGLVYLGNNNAGNGAKYRWSTGLAALTAPRIVLYVPWIGTNDAAGTITLANFSAALGAAWTRYTSDFDFSYARVVHPRTRNSGTSATAVRNGTRNFVAGQPQWVMVDVDGASVHDGAHLTAASYLTTGSAIWAEFTRAANAEISPDPSFSQSGYYSYSGGSGTATVTGGNMTCTTCSSRIAFPQSSAAASFNYNKYVKIGVTYSVALTFASAPSTATTINVALLGGTAASFSFGTGDSYPRTVTQSVTAGSDSTNPMTMTMTGSFTGFDAYSIKLP